MRHNRTLHLTALAVGLAVSAMASSAAAYQVYPPPSATLLIGNDLFQMGQSDTLGPAISQTIDEYWMPGPCPDPLTGSMTYCDDIRFGMTFYGIDDGMNGCADDIISLYSPQEDGGGLIDARISTFQVEARTDPFKKYCYSSTYRVHDTGLRRLREDTFPGGSGADPEIMRDWWLNAHLTLHVVGGSAQTSDTQPDGRALKSLQEACVSLYGGSPWTGGDPAGTLPPMPTWVMLARRFDDPGVAFGEVLAAAGGTGTCCYDPTGMGACDPVADPMDICSQVFDGRSDAQLRADLAAGRYVCSGGYSTTSTGHMDFGDPPSSSGTLAAIRCHLVGETQNDNCDSNQRSDTDLFGLFRCIRPIPPGATGVKVCYDNTYLRGEGVTAGRDHNCVLQNDGTAKCWGSNGKGQLGDGTNTSTFTPTAVSTLTGIKSIAAGEHFTCALTEDFAVYCWGEEDHFQHANDNKNEDTAAPGAPVKNFTDAIALDAGRDHACTILKDGTVWCWGSGQDGATGQGDTADRYQTVQVPIYQATDISAGKDYTCASVANGEVWCWGRNGKGQVDSKGDTTSILVPTRVPDLPAATRVAAGDDHSCAVVDGAEVYCWGDNDHGQLGDGTTQDSTVNGKPGRASGLVGAIDVCVGHDFSCSVTGDGELYCWGRQPNDLGIADASVPTLVPGVTDARRIACGDQHVCVLDELGEVSCFGGSFTGTGASDVPVEVRVGDLDYLGPECISLEESRGDFEYVDPGKTLVYLNAELCDTGDLFIPEYPCPINAPCSTDMKGRCSEGIVRECDIYGDPICTPKRKPMPEVCNGLDDDCDGQLDNLSDSIWGQDGLPSDLPSGYDRIHCNKENTCVCPNGSATAHNGGNSFQSYIDSWTPVCECSEALAPDESTYSPTPADDAFTDPQAACTVQAIDDRTGGGLGAALLALLMGMGLMIWRRR